METASRLSVSITVYSYKHVPSTVNEKLNRGKSRSNSFRVSLICPIYAYEILQMLARPANTKAPLSFSLPEQTWLEQERSIIELVC